MNKKQIFFLILFAINFIGYGFLANSIGHEFGHVILNEGRWSGRICVLGCKSVESVAGFHSSTAWVELIAPFTDLTRNEFVVSFFGWGLGLLSCFGFGGALFIGYSNTC